MIVLYILLSLFVLLLAVLLLPVRIAFRLVDEKICVSLRFLCFRYRLYPKKNKHRSAKVIKKKAPKANESLEKESAAGEVRELLRVSLPRVPRVFGAIDVPKFRLRLRIAAEDPAKCAELFGAACAAFGLAWYHLDRVFAFHRPRIDIEPDFEGDKTEILLFADIRTCAIKLLVAGLPVLTSYLKRKIHLSGGKTK